MDRSVAICRLGWTNLKESLICTNICTNTGLSRCLTPQFGCFKGRAIGSTRLRKVVQTEKSSLKPMKAMAKEINPRYAELAAAIDVALPIVHPEGLYEAMRYAVGGRHLFAFLCLTACELVGGDSDNLAMAAACAVEMCVASALIQDDFPCLDNATMRRGKPTTHKAFGEATACLAMTTLIGISFESIVKKAVTRAGMPVERKLQLVEELARTLVRAGWGQYMDAHEVEGEGEADLERMEYINSHKASPWFEVAMVMGGIVGGGSDEQIDDLRKFGRYVGLMHTFIDEVNDATLSTEAMGKDAGLDSQNKKRNFFTVLGQDKCLAMADHLSRKAKLQLAAFENKKYTSILEELVDMYKTHGVSINNPTFSHSHSHA